MINRIKFEISPLSILLSAILVLAIVFAGKNTPHQQQPETIPLLSKYRKTVLFAGKSRAAVEIFPGDSHSFNAHITENARLTFSVLQQPGETLQYEDRLQLYILAALPGGSHRVFTVPIDHISPTTFPVRVSYLFDLDNPNRGRGKFGMYVPTRSWITDPSPLVLRRNGILIFEPGIARK